MELKRRSNRRFQSFYESTEPEELEDEIVEDEDNTISSDDTSDDASNVDDGEHPEKDTEEKPSTNKEKGKEKSKENKKEEEEFQLDDDEGFPSIPQYMQDRLGGEEEEVTSDFDDGLLGNDTNDMQNEYNEKDVALLNQSIAEEMQASSSYSKNIMQVSSEVLKKLYADIGDEERFHAEQFLYAKSLITGEKYEPQDPNVKTEYEELISGGMEEEDALYTVADRMRLTAGNKDVEEDAISFEDMNDQLELLEMSVQQYTTLYDYICDHYSGEDINSNLMNLMESYFPNLEEIDQISMYMEATNIVQPSTIISGNPFKVLYDLVRGIWKLAINLVHAMKRMIAKSQHKTHNRIAWIKKNGINGLFRDGVKFYFWNVENNTPARNSTATFCHLLFSLTRDISKNFFPNGANQPDGIIQKLQNEINENNKSVVKTIYVDGNIDRGIETIKNITLDKTKVIIDDKNRASMIKYLFENNADMLSVLYSGSTRLTMLLSITSEIIQKAQQAYGTPGTDVNPEAFKKNIKNMQAVGKGCNMLIKAMTHDIRTLLRIYDNLDDMIKNNTLEGNSAGLIVGVHRQRVEQDEAIKQANQMRSAPIDNANQFTPLD